MKSKINPETGELVWEGETEAEKAQADKANKTAETAPLEALAEAFGETEPPEDFATALCALLCQIENEGGGSEAVSKTREELETAARAAFEKEGGETLKAIVEQFDIFQDIG